MTTPTASGDPDRAWSARPTGRHLVAAAAANLASWHQSSVAALGLDGHAGRRWWTCSLPGPTIYHSAIALEPRRGRGRWADRRHLRELRVLLDRPDARYHSVCDAWNELDLAALGLSRRSVSPWFARSPDAGAPQGQIDAAAEPHRSPLAVSAVVDRESLLSFERTMARAFEVPILIPPFAVHAPPILDDPRMHVLVGSLDGEPVTVAMAYRAHGVLGIYGVGTVPEHRRAGLATSMMRAVLAIDTRRPAILQPSPMAQSLYRKLGFAPIGSFAHWV